jgi:predicted nucleotidyltransferase
LPVKFDRRIQIDKMFLMKEYFYLSEKAKKNTLRKITSVLKKRAEIVFAYCHGSFLLKGIKFRDIDIAVYLKEGFKTDIFDYEQKIGDLLERKIKYPVDVKVLNIAPFYFLNNVFRTGKLLFSRDDDLLVKLIESSSIEAIANYDFSLQSLKELIS